MNTVSTQKRRYELKARAEGQQKTRGRIVAAAVRLHQEVGVRNTTVADIARRAGVQRVTVYNHFADLDELLPACSAHWLERHPMPDLSEAFAIEDPRERVCVVLRRLYPWYRENERMQLNVQGDRNTVPELERWMARSADVRLAELAGALAAGFGLEGEAAERARALARLALDFWTWRRLSTEGLDDEQAADLMSGRLP